MFATVQSFEVHSRYVLSIIFSLIYDTHSCVGCCTSAQKGICCCVFFIYIIYCVCYMAQFYFKWLPSRPASRSAATFSLSLVKIKSLQRNKPRDALG